MKSQTFNKLLVRLLSKLGKDSRNKAKVQTCRDKPQVSSSGGTLTQIDAITALTKQVKALKYHIASMRETYDHTQETAIQNAKSNGSNGRSSSRESISSQSTPLVPSPETPPLSTPKPKENLEPNPHQPPILCPSRLQNHKFQALENPTGRVNHFVYRIDSYEAFCFDVDHQEEKSSGNTTSHSDHSLPDYEAFCFNVDHQEEKSSGSATSHFDLSFLEYESFYFDLSIDPLPPAERSDSHHEEFADELAHIISLPKYDHFYFDLEDDPGELTRILQLMSLMIFLSYPIRFHILPLDDFSTISFVSDSLFLTDPSEIETFLSFPSGNEDKVFDHRILLIDGVLSFTSKSPHLFNDNLRSINVIFLVKLL
ncbi:hypothetical protein Tco_1023702 [Tanacetum coccineum]